MSSYVLVGKTELKPFSLICDERELPATYEQQQQGHRVYLR